MKILILIFCLTGSAKAQYKASLLDTITGLWKYENQMDTIIRNLEYVTVHYVTGNQKLFHVQYLVKRGKAFFYPNMYPVQVVNYKQKDSAEVTVKK